MILTESGFSKGKALLFNFLSGVPALIGTVIGLLVTNNTLNRYFLTFVAGSFLYIGLSTLLPVLEKEAEKKTLGVKLVNLIVMVLGVVFMVLLSLIEHLLESANACEAHQH